MKSKNKVFITFIFISLLLSFTSCKKKYRCECVIYDKNGAYLRNEQSSYNERKRSDAQSACKGKEFPPSKICAIQN